MSCQARCLRSGEPSARGTLKPAVGRATPGDRVDYAGLGTKIAMQFSLDQRFISTSENPVIEYERSGVPRSPRPVFGSLFQRFRMSYSTTGLFDNRACKRIIIRIISICFLFCVSTLPLAAEELTSEPVVIPSDATVTSIADAQGNTQKPKLAFFSIYVGNRFSLSDANAVDAAKSFAATNILRSDEVIYKNTDSTLSQSKAGIVPEPTLRLEWEVPFEYVPFLPAWSAFSANLSFETGYSAPQSLVASSGNFRYQNTQANHVALTDVTYSGNLNVNERRYNVTPMLGFGIEFTNPRLQQINELHLLFRIAGGLAMQNAQRNYELMLTPQYISAGAFSDTYVIKSSMVQSYSLALLPATRVELGARMRLSSNLHISLVGSLMAYFGSVNYENIGSFTEQAGIDKVTFQKIVSSTSQQDYMRLMPAAFLALSMEL